MASGSFRFLLPSVGATASEFLSPSFCTYVRNSTASPLESWVIRKALRGCGRFPSPAPPDKALIIPGASCPRPHFCHNAQPAWDPRPPECDRPGG